MRKLDLSNYPISVAGQEPQSYLVRDSLVAVLFYPRDLSKAESLIRDDLATRILLHPADEILLEEVDFERIKSSLDAFTGFTRNDVPLIRRIESTPTVEVEQCRSSPIASP